MDVNCSPPAAVAEALANKVGVKKTQNSFKNLLILGILAGVYIAFGAQLATIVGHDISKFLGVGIAKLVIGGVFSVGLMLVVIAGAELFTGNNLIMMSVLNKKATVGSMLRNWGIVFFANLIGSLLIVWLIHSSGLLNVNDGAVGAKAVAIANGKVNLGFMEAFSRAILCNWLVCLAVWLAVAARTVIGKIFACFFPIMAFVASGFEHSIANMYFIPIGILNKGMAVAGLDVSNLNLSGFIVTNLIPVTLGNIVGGAFFVSTLYYFVFLKGKKA
ncbi:MAG: formate/nitrite transporter family protein [Candidatus Aegiribacteria sp.]|nr:formate/nitrite transporter family protein [Candidatus Aegiribacteria sp.]